MAALFWWEKNMCRGSVYNSSVVVSIASLAMLVPFLSHLDKRGREGRVDLKLQTVLSCRSVSWQGTAFQQDIQQCMSHTLLTEIPLFSLNLRPSDQRDGHKSEMIVSVS